MLILICVIYAELRLVIWLVLTSCLTSAACRFFCSMFWILHLSCWTNRPPILWMTDFYSSTALVVSETTRLWVWIPSSNILFVVSACIAQVIYISLWLRWWNFNYVQSQFRHVITSINILISDSTFEFVKLISCTARLALMLFYRGWYLILWTLTDFQSPVEIKFNWKY